MMKFAGLGYSEEQIDLLDIASKFCRDRSPISAVRKQMESATGFDIEIWNEFSSLGWTAIAIPQDFGGAGLSLAEIVPVAEQMGRNMLALPLTVSALAAQALLHSGTEAQKNKYLTQLADGKIGTLALYEPHGDWDLGHIDAIATREGEYVKLSWCRSNLNGPLHWSFCPAKIYPKARCAANASSMKTSAAQR
jgi:acyl-CoA dehydrogenase